MIRFSRPCSFTKGDDMKRARHQRGSVVFDKRRKIWNYLWCEDGHRRTKLLGTARELPTKTAAWRAAEPLRRELDNQPSQNVIKVETLVNLYRLEKMPHRLSTRRGYEAWIKNHLLPRWRESEMTELQARPVELWLQSLPLSPKSRVHIRGLLRGLWEYAMWRGEVPIQRNPMELVRIHGASKRTRQPRSLAVDEFQKLVEQLGEPARTIALVCVCFGLRISECLALKWCDIDWMNARLRVERGIVRQQVDDVKTVYSGRLMSIDKAMLGILAAWRNVAPYSGDEYWMFASPAKHGRLPMSYPWVWLSFQQAAERAGIGKLGTHSLRHSYRSWLDAVGTAIAVQQKLMRHSDIRTTINIYGDVVTDEMAQAHSRVVELAIPRKVIAN
jgi:integrase